jgi:ankyrin repeat protein
MEFLRMPQSVGNSFSLDPFINYCFLTTATVEGAKEYIDKGADVTAFDSWGYTALHAAVSHGNIKLAEYLISLGADVNARTKHWRDGPPDPGDSHPTPLGLAVECIYPECALMLLEKGADPNILISEGGPDGRTSTTRHTILISAIWGVSHDEKMIPVIDALFSCGVDIHTLVNGHSLLHYAKEECSSPVVHEMLQDRLNGWYITEFEKTADRRATDMIETLAKGILEPLKPSPRIRIQKPGGKRPE